MIFALFVDAKFTQFFYPSLNAAVIAVQFFNSQKRHKCLLCGRLAFLLLEKTGLRFGNQQGRGAELKPLDVVAD